MVLHTYSYRKLDTTDFGTVLRDEDARELFLDGLALIDDFLCDLLPEPIPQRNSDIGEIRDDLNGIIGHLKGNRPLAENLEENSVTGQHLRSEALRLRPIGESGGVDDAISRFRNSLVDQFTAIIANC